MRKTTNQFIDQAQAVHGDRYDYSETTYVNSSTRVNIKCKIHGMFIQWPANHVNAGTGCKKCTDENRSNNSGYTKKPRTDITKVRLTENCRLIYLPNNKYTVVDAMDYDRVMQFKWIESAGYIISTDPTCPQIRLHRFILGIFDPNIHLDHKNRNPYDNRRSNLRICTPTQNNFNTGPRKGCTSIYKGVYFDKRCRKWLAKITESSKTRYIGLFTDEAIAAQAYDKKAKELFGEFAYLNFPDLV